MARRPPRPPAGYYDPALDAQLRASRRGLIDLRQDTELGDARAAQDYTFGMEGFGRERDRGYQDIDRQVAVLQRGYQQLARRQGEGNRLAGVLSSGMLAKQMQIRAANMAFERQPLDVGRTRIDEDYATGTGRLGVDYARGGFDRGTALTRAEREQSEFGLDIGEQMRYQATAAGWVPPRPPPRPPPAAATPTPTTGGVHGPGPQNLGRGNWLQNVRNDRGKVEYRWRNGTWHSKPQRGG